VIAPRRPRTVSAGCPARKPPVSAGPRSLSSGTPELDEDGVCAAQDGHRPGRHAVRTGKQAQRYGQRPPCACIAVSARCLPAAVSLRLSCQENRAHIRQGTVRVASPGTAAPGRGPGPRPCPVEHGTGSRIRIEATSMAPGRRRRAKGRTAANPRKGNAHQSRSTPTFPHVTTRIGIQRTVTRACLLGSHTPPRPAV
jgi:hypothetical protein